MDDDFKYIKETSTTTSVTDGVHPFSSRTLVIVFATLGVLALFYFQFIRPPTDFPSNEMIVVEKGETLSKIADVLLEKHIIKSSFLFKAFLSIFGGTRGLIAGDYEIDLPQNLITISWKFANGAYDLKNVRITIPEGKNMREISKLFGVQFHNFNPIEFLRLASTSEGYLFPDTYLFLPNVTEDDVYKVLKDTFKIKISAIDKEVQNFQNLGFGKIKKISLKDIITMASVLEEEGRTMDTRRMIAGILWNRLSIGMPLQVDASIVYLTQKVDGSKLTQDDFKIDSPYNTYLYRGLPPTPISNPGIDAIRAAVTPTPSKYLYYITDKKGGFYPAKTYDEQLMNQAKYLNY